MNTKHRKVNLFLVGAAKSGTTALQVELAQHPDIAALPIKEPGHFCTDLRTSGFEKDYNRLIQWDEDYYFGLDPLPARHLGFVESRAHYQALAKAAPHAKWTLDASTAYLYSETAAEAIRAYNPEAKILVILRDPTARAFSHYNMALKYGMERDEPLVAFEREAKLARAQWGRDECYLELGKYASQLRLYLQHFPPDQVMVLFYDQWQRNRGATLAKIARFLGLHAFPPSEGVRANETTVPRFPALNRIGMQLLAPVRQALPSQTVQRLKELTQKPPEPIPSEADTFLRAYFLPEVEALEQLLDVDLTHWK